MKNHVKKEIMQNLLDAINDLTEAMDYTPELGRLVAAYAEIAKEQDFYTAEGDNPTN